MPGDGDLVAVHLQRRQPERVRVPVRGQAHHLALVALAGKHRLRQQEIEHAQAHGRRALALVELLAQALEAAPTVHAVEGRHLAPVPRHFARAVPGLGEVGHGAALPVHDHHRRLLEGRGVEHAVQVRQVVRDARALAAGGQVQHLGDLLLVLVQALHFGVRGVALHQRVDGLIQPRHHVAVHVTQIADLAPVVLAPGDALLLDGAEQP